MGLAIGVVIAVTALGYQLTTTGSSSGAGSASTDPSVRAVAGTTSADQSVRTLACEIISLAEAEAATGISGLVATHDPEGQGGDVCSWESGYRVVLVTLVEPIDSSERERSGSISYLVDELFVVEAIVGNEHVVFLTENDERDVTAKLQQLAHLVTERAAP